MIQPDTEHCVQCAPDYDEETGEDDDTGIWCVHCECCCDCLACLYGPRNEVPAGALPL